jgi:hypothetical protein
VGVLDVRQAVSPETFAAAWPGRGPQAAGIITAPAALAGLPHVEVAADEAARVRCGQLVPKVAGRVIDAVGPARCVGADSQHQRDERCVTLLNEAGELVAVARIRDEVAQLVVVMPEQEHGDVPGTV